MQVKHVWTKKKKTIQSVATLKKINPLKLIIQKICIKEGYKVLPSVYKFFEFFGIKLSLKIKKHFLNKLAQIKYESYIKMLLSRVVTNSKCLVKENL